MRFNHILQLSTVLVLLFCSTALAIPKLQLDISDGVYDFATETTVATTEAFTLYALIDPFFAPGSTFYLSAAVSPQVEDGADLGSFTFDGNKINVTSDMTYGNPPIDDGLKDIGGHSIFDTYYYEFAFNSSSKDFVKTTAYNTEPNNLDPEINALKAGDDIFSVAFDIDVTSLLDDYIIHFDLYTFDEGGKRYFAPFSHDAETGPPVPEPSTLILLGAGLIGLAAYRRNKQ